MKDPWTLLNATSFDVLDLSKQLAAEQAKEFPDGDRIKLLSARLQDAQTAQGNIATYLDQKGERQALNRWDRQYQAAQLDWQMHSGNAQLEQAAAFHADQLGFSYAQLNQGAQQFEQTRQDTFKKLGIEQGFQHAERALDRSFQTEERVAGQGFVTSEREASQVYRTGEREATQGYQTGERREAQQYQTGERRETQGYQTGERRETQDFTAGQNREGRDHQVRLQLMSEEFNKAENQMGREIQMKIAQMNDAVARGQLDLARANSEFDRWAKTRQLELQGQAEESANRRFDKEFAQKERQFGVEMGFNVARADTEENRAQQTFKQGEHQFGAKMGEDQRQFNESFGQKRKGDAMARLAELIQQGYATGGPEVQVGGGAGGSIGQIMSAFGGDPAAAQQTYYKPAAPVAALSQINADLNAAPLTSTPYQEQQYQGSDALDQFRKMLTGG